MICPISVIYWAPGHGGRGENALFWDVFGSQIWSCKDSKVQWPPKRDSLIRGVTRSIHYLRATIEPTHFRLDQIILSPQIISNQINRQDVLLLWIIKHLWIYSLNTAYKVNYNSFFGRLLWVPNPPLYPKCPLPKILSMSLSILPFFLSFHFIHSHSEGQFQVTIH